MIVPRTFVLLLGAAMACAAPGPRRRPPTRGIGPPLDSATLSACAVRPEGCSAGWAECVLKDQSPPVREIPRRHGAIALCIGTRLLVPRPCGPGVQ